MNTIKMKNIVSLMLAFLMVFALIPGGSVTSYAKEVNFPKTLKLRDKTSTTTMCVTGISKKQKVSFTVSGKQYVKYKAHGHYIDVTAKKNGSGTITATVKGKKYKCHFTVDLNSDRKEMNSDDLFNEFGIVTNQHFQEYYTKIQDYIKSKVPEATNGNRVYNGDNIIYTDYQDFIVLMYKDRDDFNDYNIYTYVSLFRDAAKPGKIMAEVYEAKVNYFSNNPFTFKKKVAGTASINAYSFNGNKSLEYDLTQQDLPDSVTRTYLKRATSNIEGLNSAMKEDLGFGLKHFGFESLNTDK